MPRVFPLIIPFVLMLQHSLAQCDSTIVASMNIPQGAKLLKEYQLNKRECASYSYVFVKNSTYAVCIKQPKRRQHRVRVSFEHDKTGRKIAGVKKIQYGDYEVLSFLCLQTGVYNFVIEYKSPDECTPMQLFLVSRQDP
jgi:hypothetical protein